MAKPTKPEEPTAKAPYGYTKAGKPRKRPGRPDEGKPTVYNPHHHPQKVEALAKCGLTDKEISIALDITEQDLNLWKHEHSEFLESLKKGKAYYDDDDVVKALRHRAIGYEHPEDKIFLGPGGDPVIVPTIRHYPPDTAAAFIWLKNRQPEKWRDRREVDLHVDDLRQKPDKELKSELEELEALEAEGHNDT